MAKAPFESGCFHIEMLLLIYSLFCKIQKMLRNLGCSLLRGVKLQRTCLVSVSEITVEATLISISRRQLSVLVCKMFIEGQFS